MPRSRTPQTTQIVVIGHYPDYLLLAQKLGASCFSVSQEIWEALDDDGRWQMNRDFLDDAIRRGSVFVLSTPPLDVREGSWLDREIQYLFDNGYEYDATTNIISR